MSGEKRRAILGAFICFFRQCGQVGEALVLVPLVIQGGAPSESSKVCDDDTSRLTPGWNERTKKRYRGAHLTQRDTDMLFLLSIGQWANCTSALGGRE